MNANRTPARLRVIPAIVLAALALGPAACSPPAPPATTATEDMSEPMNDGQVLHVLHVVNQREIRQAELALERSRSPHVQKMAREIIENHRASDERIATVADATGNRLKESPLSRRVQRQASAFREQLIELSGEAFDSAYLARQLERQAVIRNALRPQLLRNAGDPQVRQLIETVTTVKNQELPGIGFESFGLRRVTFANPTYGD